MAKKNHLDDLPTIHPRHEIRTKARNEFAQFVLDWWKRHELTMTEQLSIQSEHLAGQLNDCVKSEGRE